MTNRLTKTALAVLLLGTLNATALAPAQAESQDQLPDMGTSAGGTLSIGQELAMGDFYVRQLRASAPLINDPLLIQYINQLGNRLVASAYSVRTPFHFYLVRNDEINAFAFFGGNVVLHSALFRVSDNESQLASVLAHEISHVTQRHLARAMEDQQRNAPLTWVGALGSILLAMANPTMGMAALSGTMAGTQQGMISFTQSNEQEADRIGIQVLQRAGFDPEDAHALAGPAQPGIGTLIFTGAGHWRVQQHVETDPQQISRPQQGERRQRQRVADQQRADARHHNRNHQQMAEQQAGDGGHHHPAANARRDHIGPIHTRRDHQ